MSYPHRVAAHGIVIAHCLNATTTEGQIGTMARRSRTSVLALQVAVGVFGLVPVAAGLAGTVAGFSMLGEDASVSADSHFRYLSGLLLAIGLLFWSSIPRIERQTRLVRTLTAIVFVGGLARLGGVVLVGEPSAPMLFGLTMELVVTPLVCFWQSRIAVRSSI
jgi:hypothetical protein